VKETQYGVAFLFKRWAWPVVIIIHEVEFKADATAATHEQVDKVLKKKHENNRIENFPK
jgi:hypothetical protein